MPTVQATVFRTKMIGGGTSYDVYLACDQKGYRPISGFQYATIVCRDGKQYFSVTDFLRTPTIDALPAFSDDRWNSFKRLRKAAERLEFKLAKQAFPELAKLPKMPPLWADWSLPHATKTVSLTLRNNFLA